MSGKCFGNKGKGMLGIDFLGYKLKNPLMLTEGPLSGTESLLIKASESEAGLIFTKGIRLEEKKSTVPLTGNHY